MDPNSIKHYHRHDIDSLAIYNTYFCASADENYLNELLVFPIKMVVNEVKLGRIKGDKLIDLSAAANVFHLLPICKYFKDISILEFNDCCLKDVQKWLNKDPDGFDWSHAAKIVAELEDCRDNWEEKEDDLRRRVKRILKCDFAKENPTCPVILQKVDCVFNLFVLGHISKDLDSYSRNLTVTSRMMKLGGRLLLVGGFNATHYTVGPNKYHILNFHKADLQRLLKGSGFSIDHMEVMESKIRNDIMYYDQVFFVSAVKIKEQ